MVPVAHVEPIAQAQRMVAARLGVIGPRIFLAARGPLSRNPPAAHLHALRGILPVQDHADVGDGALNSRRDVRVAAVERIAVHAFASGLPISDLPWARTIRYVLDDQDGGQ